MIKSSTLTNVNGTFEVYTFVDPSKTFTVVNATLAHGGEKVTGTGVSKRNSEDPYDPVVGHGLALARALCDAAGEIERAVHP